MSRPSVRSLLLYLFGVAAILVVTYPLSDNYRYGLLTAGQMAAVYAEMTGIISLVGILTWLLLGWTIRRSHYLRATGAFVSTTVLLGGLGIFMFHAPPRLKGGLLLGNMQSVFFRDFMGIKFARVTAPLCALLLAVVMLASRTLTKDSQAG
jgi:hypothetical protein